MGVRLLGPLLILSLATCSEPVELPENSQVAWSDVTKPGYADDLVIAAYLSTDPYLTPELDNGVAVFVHEGGRTDLLPVGALNNGTIVANQHGGVGFSSGTATYAVGGAKSAVLEHPERLDTGDWSGVRDDGSFVTMFNSGAGESGYESDVFWTEAGKPAHSYVPDAPGATGIAGDTLFVAGMSDFERGQINVLYSLDLTGPAAKARERMRWQVRDVATMRASFSSSDLFEFEGALWFLDQTGIASLAGDRLPAPDGSRTSLNLNRIDLETFEFTSTELATYRRDMIADTGNGWLSVALAATRGHLFDGKLYTIDHTGSILMVDVKKGTIEPIGEVSKRVQKADAEIAWQGGTMAVVSTDDDQAWLETYDLTSGARTSTIDLPELADLMTRNSVLVLWSVAAGSDLFEDDVD